MFQLLPPKGGFCFEYTFIGVRDMIQTNQSVVMIPVKRLLWVFCLSVWIWAGAIIPQMNEKHSLCLKPKTRMRFWTAFGGTFFKSRGVNSGACGISEG